VAGVVLIGVGLELLGLARVVPARLADLARRTIGRALRLVIQSRSRAAPLALGVFNAFLPCHLVYAFAAQAAHAGTPATGALTMLAFGAGTVPLMATLGVAGQWAPRLARHTTRPAGLVMLVFGVVMLLRASGWLDGQGHHG
jgi:sulfite exporter TauE/SafE